MAKPNDIRKKALDFARKRQWDKALTEFNKLVEIEQHNPNLFNEIGDLHIKVDNKREAFKSYHKAVDAYTTVGLHNNAVAVCKKIIRLNAGDHVVYGKLARLRHRQGFHREAETYSLDFFAKATQEPEAASDDIRELAVNIALSAEKSPAVLEKAAEYLIACDLRQDAGSVLDKLFHYHTAQGNTSEIEKVKSQMKSIGIVPAPQPTQEQTDKLETVESHRSQSADFDDCDLDSAISSSVPPHLRRGHGQDVARDFGMVDIGAAGESAAGDEAPGIPEQASSTTSENADAFSPDTTGVVFDEPGPGSEPDIDAADTGEAAMDQTADDCDSFDSVKEYVIPDESIPEAMESLAPKEAIETASGSALDALLDSGSASLNDSHGSLTSGLASEVTADVAEDDYRSHYDLGMAYVEMDLLNEAIREFQFAANSAPFGVRSLEMIGRCFIKLNKPQLAIKQLTRGLQLVGSDDRDALGIKYDLGLAYEMCGDDDKAQSFFEDVYVIDVTFRDIEEKVKKYAS